MISDDEEVLNKKDMEWSSKNVSDVEATPSSVEQANLPAEDQQPSEQPEKSKEKSTLHKVLVFHFNHRETNEQAFTYLTHHDEHV